MSNLRTVEQAIAQANAKERIRNARGLGAAGAGIFFTGITLLMHWSTWRMYNQLVRVHIHGGPSFSLSLGAIVGVLAVATGPIVAIVGGVRLRRALAAAARDPMTAPILSRSME